MNANSVQYALELDVINKIFSFRNYNASSEKQHIYDIITIGTSF